MEKYSVLMSLYIKEKPEYLRLAIQSMINQTVQPDEIVIVKDGEITEELQHVLDEYTSNYPSLFNIVGYETNHGLGYALNFGLAHTKNELVARMDTDDISLTDRCEKQLEFFEKNPHLDIVGGDMTEFIGEQQNTVGTRIVPMDAQSIEKYLKKRCPFNHITVMYKKTAVQNAGGYLDWFWNEDYYLWLRMYLNKCNFANTGTILASARVGKEMYNRRGGMKYFKSEAKLQKYMLNNKIIGFGTYLMNVFKRFIVQLLLPNKIRGWVFRKFARS